MSAILGIHPPSIIHDASHGSSSRAQINEGVINNYMTEFQRNAVDGVIHSAVPDGMGGSKSNSPTPALMATKPSPTHASPGHRYFPGSASKYNK
jgi:hypothetical protein